MVVARQLPERNGHEWVEFEEVPGPAPEELEADGTLVLNVILI
jgi:hypothetical protein